jgi:hypothetical protein
MSQKSFRRSAPLAAMLPLLLIVGAGPAQQREEKPAPNQAPEQVWQAGLTRMAGKYRFIQVASPGGLWRIRQTGDKRERDQVSLSQLPQAFRETLEKAEIQILDLQVPGEVSAQVGKSPGVGGMLRHYTEEARGKLVMRGLPGVADRERDTGEFSGEVVFGIDHTSLSNPTVPGVWLTRFRTEPTWGAATLDYADLTAMKVSPEAAEDADPEYPLFNSRILRSGLEIFAFVQWFDPSTGDGYAGDQYVGAVRLVRADVPMAEE